MSNDILNQILLNTNNIKKLEELQKEIGIINNQCEEFMNERDSLKYRNKELTKKLMGETIY